MKTRLITHFIGSIFLLSSSSTFANFDFCNDSSDTGEGGNGTFQQQILKDDIVEIGELPAGIEGISIELTSSQDVDIQLDDKQSKKKIVHWPNGILNGPNKQITSYNGVTVEWSGYNGDGTGTGNEYIKITGKTNRTFIMKAFGYQAGNATVDYSWTGGTATDCNISETGGDTFQQQILNQDVIDIGDIPPGVNDLFIKLISGKDVDIQLYDKDDGTKIVAWPDGVLNGASTQSTNYQDMTIEWSGYSGDATSPGNEYIKISGKSTRNLTMKAFGYEAGFATVEYSWGDQNQQPEPEPVPQPDDNTDPVDNNLDAVKENILNLINQARSVGRQCGNQGFFAATTPVTWNNKLFKAALAHSKNMANQNFFSHTGKDGSNPGTRISAQGYNWSTYMENISAGQSTVEIAITGWINSPGHCRNIMSSSIQEIGLGSASNQSSQYGIYWTLNGAASQ